MTSGKGYVCGSPMFSGFWLSVWVWEIGKLSGRFPQLFYFNIWTEVSLCSNETCWKSLSLKKRQPYRLSMLVYCKRSSYFVCSNPSVFIWRRLQRDNSYWWVRVRANNCWWARARATDRRAAYRNFSKPPSGACHVVSVIYASCESSLPLRLPNVYDPLQILLEATGLQEFGFFMVQSTIDPVFIRNDLPRHAACALFEVPSTIVDWL